MSVPKKIISCICACKTFLLKFPFVPKQCARLCTGSVSGIMNALKLAHKGQLSECIVSEN